MKINRMTYLAAAFALMGAATSCEHEGILEPLEFAVSLSPSNTYLAGDPVVFDFEGNADFITVWNGDRGHEYRFRDRTSVAMEDIESCELEIELFQRYGDAATVSNLDLLAGNKFAGLRGDDAATDRAALEAIAANNYTDWSALPYTPNKSGVFESYTYDITELADNFSWGFRFHHAPEKAMRTYYMNPKITVKFKGYDPQVYNYAQMEFTPFSLAAKHTADPYFHNKSGNGVLKFQGKPGSSTAGDIVYQGFNAGAAEGPIDQWAFMQPMPLNRISPDAGANIKGVTDDIRQYSHKFLHPGTYTATFIASNGNYQGSSGQAIREVSFTITGQIGQ